MCLAVPGKILSISDTGTLTRAGQVSFNGVTRLVNLAFVPDAAIGDFVIVHVGFAITHLDEQEATRIFALLAELAAKEETHAVRR